MVPTSFKDCPACGGELMEKQVEKVLRGGAHTAVAVAKAEVCLHCGERLYDQETVRRFEQIHEELKTYDVSEFEPMGKSFKVA